MERAITACAAALPPSFLGMWPIGAHLGDGGEQAAQVGARAALTDIADQGRPVDTTAPPFCGGGLERCSQKADPRAYEREGHSLLCDRDGYGTTASSTPSEHPVDLGDARSSAAMTGRRSDPRSSALPDDDGESPR